MRDLSLYQRLLGAAWSALPAPIRACLDAVPRLVATGRFTVTHARSPFARFAIALARLPPAGDDIAICLEVRALGDEQIWDRDFDDFRMTTIQSFWPDGRLAERQGWLALLFEVKVEAGVLVYRPRGLRLKLGRLALPIPACCGPRVEARVWCAPGEASMRVHVAIALPLLGIVMTYGGAIVRVPST